MSPVQKDNAREPHRGVQLPRPSYYQIERRDIKAGPIGATLAREPQKGEPQ